MPLIKTSELAGVALDWAVAVAEGDTPKPEHGWTSAEVFRACYVAGARQFSDDWKQGGPILERHRLILRPSFGGGWECAASPSVWRTGPTPLIAAMRCYVAAKLGDGVDVPDELAFAGPVI